MHDTFLDVEPFSGYTLRGGKRLQLVTSIDDWSMPSLPFSSYYGWNETVVDAAKEQILEKVVVQVGALIRAEVKELVEEAVDAFCAESRDNRAEACHTVGLEVDALIEGDGRNPLRQEPPPATDVWTNTTATTATRPPPPPPPRRGLKLRAAVLTPPRPRAQPRATKLMTTTSRARCVTPM